MNVKVLRVRDVPLPNYESKGAMAFDFTAAETTVIASNSVGRIPSGLVMQTPKGHGLFIYPRSSTPKKHGLSIPHGAGLIDPDYSGPEDEILLQYYNFTEQEVIIEKGTRIAQGVILEVPRIEFEEVEEIKKPSRGGFGSTGGH